MTLFLKPKRPRAARFFKRHSSRGASTFAGVRMLLSCVEPLQSVVVQRSHCSKQNKNSQICSAGNRLNSANY
jgi:hypothetical protein